MMKSRMWLYFLKQAVTSISNNRMVHVIGMGTMVVSLLIFGSFLFIFVNFNVWIHGWGHSLSMSVYLMDGIEPPTRKQISSAIKEFPNAKIESFISKEEAFNSLKRSLGPEAGLITALSHNPLPASFEVVFEDIESPETDPQKIKKVLEEMTGVAEVHYSDDWMKRFEGLMNMVKLVGVVMGGFLCIGVLFIMTNTIKLTIYSRRHEIEIQKLVGATDWFVKTPFLLEGFIQGLLSGGISLLMLFLGYLIFAEKKLHFLGLAVLDFTFLPGDYVLSIMIISVFLGLAGSFIAVGRFLAAESFIDI